MTIYDTNISDVIMFDISNYRLFGIGNIPAVMSGNVAYFEYESEAGKVSGYIEFQDEAVILFLQECPFSYVDSEPVTYYKTEMIDISSEQKQFEANIFISNFADLNMDVTDLGIYLEPTMDFIYEWLCFNRPNKVEHQINGGYNQMAVFSLAEANDVSARFFNKHISEENTLSFQGGYKYTDAYYYDGYFYFPDTDPQPIWRIAVVDKLIYRSDGEYRMEFNVYECDFEPVRDTYYITPDQASASTSMHLVLGVGATHGSAIVTPFDYNGRETYQLLSYHFTEHFS